MSIKIKHWQRIATVAFFLSIILIPGRAEVLGLVKDSSILTSNSRFVVDTLESHTYTIRNRMTNEYLCIADTQVVCKASPDSLSKLWMIIWLPKPHRFWMINQMSHTYMNYKNHKPFVSIIKPTQSSPRWHFENVEGTPYYRIRNPYSNSYINIADVVVKSTPIFPEWESAIWLIEKHQ